MSSDKWVPKEGETIWVVYFGVPGCIIESGWDSYCAKIAPERIFKTRKAAQAALDAYESRMTAPAPGAAVGQWVPKLGDRYWTYGADKKVASGLWCGDVRFLANWGRVFKTQWEAQAACDEYFGRTTAAPADSAPEAEQQTEGRKDDQGKAPWGLLPFDAVGQIVEVLRIGAQKYSPRNWEAGMDWNRPFDACLRHLTAWWGGEDKDPETGLPHLAHAGCCVLFLLAYSRRGVGKDNRPKKMY